MELIFIKFKDSIKIKLTQFINNETDCYFHKNIQEDKLFKF